MRGGTSRALFFHERDLPGTISERPGWDSIFAAALGSPDPNERQLDGLGGGISSLSKIAVIAPSSRDDADVDYSFGQVAIVGSGVSYRGNCGNISAAVGPFAVDEGLVTATGEEAVVRIHNVNTGKIIRATFALQDGKAAVRGDFTIHGVGGSGSPIRLDFLEPGGAVTGKLLPTGRPLDVLQLEGLGEIEVSLVDAANPVVFVAASAFGLDGGETPAEIGADRQRMANLNRLRMHAAVAMGVVDTLEDAETHVPNLPLVALLSRPEDELADIRVRMISAGQPHKATPLTGAMCLAVAARITDTLVADAIASEPDGPLRIAHASGVLPLDAEVRDGMAVCVTVFRTARRLMQGEVLIPA